MSCLANTSIPDDLKVPTDSAYVLMPQENKGAMESCCEEEIQTLDDCWEWCSTPGDRGEARAAFEDCLYDNDIDEVSARFANTAGDHGRSVKGMRSLAVAALLATAIDDIDSYSMVLIEFRDELGDVDSGGWDNRTEPPCDMRTTLGHTLGQARFLLNPCNGSMVPDEVSCRNVHLDECHDASTLFYSWRTFWNCLTVAGISWNKRLGEDARERIGKVELVNATIEPVDLDESFLEEFDAAGVLDLTFRCAQASCEEWSMDGRCTVEAPTTPFRYEEDGPNMDSSALSELLGAVCEDIPTLNLDIAGPGVVVSFCIQATFVAVAIVATRMIFLQPVINFVMAPYADIRRTLRQDSGPWQPFIADYARLQRFFNKLEENFVVHSIMTLLVDFHEAQCFFVLSLQAAALIATSQRADFQGTFTLFSLKENNAVTEALAHFGIVAIGLTQMVLHRLKMDSAYTLGISMATLGVATLARELAFDKERMGATISSINTVMPVDECGNLGTLRVQCLGQATRFAGTGKVKALQWQRGGYGLAFGLLCCSSFIRWVHRPHNQKFVQRLLPQQVIGRLSWTTSTLVMAVMLNILEIFGAWAHFENLKPIFGYLRPDSVSDSIDSEDGGGDHAWSIGQLLTVLVWVPVLLKFLYVLTRGIEAGFRMRLSKSYVVRKQEHRALPIERSPKHSTSNVSLQEDYRDQETFLLPQMSAVAPRTAEDGRGLSMRQYGVRSETF